MKIELVAFIAGDIFGDGEIGYILNFKSDKQYYELTCRRSEAITLKQTEPEEHCCSVTETDMNIHEQIYMKFVAQTALSLIDTCSY